jgi:hypothetical protein
VVCSACGYENQSGMHFCGMCGTPLPHRPLTTPGAQSTLSMTRVPLDGGSLLQDHTLANSSSRAGVLDMPGSSRTDVPDVPQPSIHDPAGAVADQQAVEPPPPAKELVPDVPLHEYLQTFHYEPPTDSDEKTMRGDVTVLDAATPVSPTPASEEADTSPAPLVVEHAASAPPVLSAAKPASPPVFVETKSPTEALPVTPADSVVSRLGLEPQGPAETPVERPRFLDIHEPSKESKPTASSGTSTIVGPSFLGLSDAPVETVDEPKRLDAEELPKSHWRSWVAVAVIAVFAVLGVMEWRSQVNQTDNGPVEVMKAKIRDWRHRTPSQSSQTAPVASADSNTKPDMQVVEQPKPSPASPSTSGAQTGVLNSPSGGSANSSPPPAQATTSPAAAATASPGATTPADKQPAAASASKTTNAGDKRAAASESAATNPTANSKKNAASDATAVANSDKPKPVRSDESGPDVMPAKEAAGAEEMTKAKNASDAAAQAAWLWKATAKGNPDAPVQLADMYIKGSGVPRSCEQAMVLLKTAAEKENARARNRLASMYSTGNCVQRNRLEAYRWLSSALAANPNSQWAQQNRDLIWQQMTPDERTAAEKYR